MSYISLLGIIMRRILYFLFFISGLSHAEQYVCTHTWEGKSEAHPSHFEINGETAFEKNNLLAPTYKIDKNNVDEIIMHQVYEYDSNSVITVVAINKATGLFVRSNTSTGRLNAHAKGRCERLK